MKTAILSVIYYEQDWTQTCVCLSQVPSIPIFFVDRLGVGSLAAAINTGVTGNCLGDFDYVWIITNIKFSSRVLPLLVEQMDKGGYEAITPSFKSDHEHIRTKWIDQTLPGPFVEFTAPIVRTATLLKHPLDERMPYSGHDLDWGYRIREAGGRLGVYHGVEIEHTYIRRIRTMDPITLRRAKLRAINETPTKLLLAQKYGPDWPVKLGAHY